MDTAITRDIPQSLLRCELTHLTREPIDLARAVAQHQVYCDTLAAAGLTVVRLPADEAHPDCCFVEDAAVVLDEVAVLAAPGAATRRGETAAIARALSPYRSLVTIELPATLEGGDVLQLGKTILVGHGKRTNAAGIASFAAALAPWGYLVIPIAVAGCLHLKSAVTAIDDQTLLINPRYFDRKSVPGFATLEVAPEEPGAANVLRLPRTLLSHAGFPRTSERLMRAGHAVTPIDISEFLKAEAALTCKSLLFTASPA